MAKGTTGFLLEAWKFSIYLIIPIGASWYFNNPSRRQASTEYWQYVKYPADPNTTLRADIQRLVEQQSQRAVYVEQLRQLETAASRATELIEEEEPSSSSSSNTNRERRGWWRWVSGWTGGKENADGH